MSEILKRNHETPLLLTEAVGEFAQMPEANFQAYESFKPIVTIANQQRQAFLAEEIVNPKPGLADIDETLLSESTNRLHQLLGLVETGIDDSPLRIDAFYEIIAERLASYYFVRQANRVNKMDQSSPEYDYEVNRLQELNDSLYGQPEKEVFDTLVSEEIDIANHALTVAGSEIERQIVSEYLDLLPNTEMESRQHYLPKDSTVIHYQQIVKEYYAEVLDALEIDDSRSYEPADMVELFQQAIDILDIKNWRAEIEVGGTNLNTDQTNQIVNIGETRKAIKGKTLRGLILHEVGVHVLRRAKGEETDNPLLYNLGLAGYYTNEEGLGKFVEQALAGEASVAGINHYLNASLSLGLDGVPRDFREVYEIAWRRAIVAKIGQGDQIDETIINSAKLTAYNSVFRIRRGIPADVKGVAFTKDLAYFNGTANIWHFLEKNIGDEGILERVLIGKHDPLRADHVELVKDASKNIRLE